MRQVWDKTVPDLHDIEVKETKMYVSGMQYTKDKEW